MNMNALFAEQANVIAFPPADLAGAAGLTTPWLSLKNYHRASVILIKAAGSAAEDPVLTFTQATDVAGAGSKALTSITRIDKKQHATLLETQGVWTPVAQNVANSFTADGELQAIYAIDIKAEDLDSDNDFDCFRMTIADVGTVAQLACLSVVLWGARFTPPMTPLTN